MILSSHTPQRGSSVTILILAFCSLYSGIANAADWEPNEAPELLRELFSDTLMQTTLKDGRIYKNDL